MNPAPPSTSLVAGKYELLDLIGRGGMGSVWEGRHVSLGTRVAIKFIEKEYADSAEAQKRFDNEAKAAARIQSKHAIQIHDHGVTDDGRPYIVMELLVGEPLDKRLDQVPNKRMPLPEVARILGQVARALTRAHEQGIVHRDLKPENIFLVRTPDDDDEIAKVLDFGIAKIRGPEGQALSSSTKTGAVLGTPFYMSPEQARGLRDINHRTDLWSLGVIVFKCVTGVLPFDGESLGDLLVKICTNPVPVPSHVLPGLPPAFDAWFARALDRDPDRRYQTAQHMADDLALAAGISVRRPPTSDGRSGPELAHARTTPSAQTGLAATPGSIGSGAHGSGAHGSSPLARSPNVTAVGLSASASRTAPSRSSSALVWIVGAFAFFAAAAAVVLFLVWQRDEREKKSPVTAGPQSVTVQIGATAGSGSSTGSGFAVTAPGVNVQVGSLATVPPPAPSTSASAGAATGAVPAPGASAGAGATTPAAGATGTAKTTTAKPPKTTTTTTGGTTTRPTATPHATTKPPVDPAGF